MDLPFPKETVDKIQQRINNVFEVWPEAVRNSKYFWAQSFYNQFKGASYSFLGSLHTGNYAHWPHENADQKVPGLNCTTVITEPFILLSFFGLNPEIVQFIDFKNVYPGQKVHSYTSHFSLIVDVGRRNPYLFDPFQEVFGPILERGDGFMRVGKTGESKKFRREYKQLLVYSAQNFVDMMERLRTPAGSLEVLSAYQRLTKEHSIQGMLNFLKVGYDEDENVVTVKLYVPKEGIQDKAVLSHTQFDSQGRIKGNKLELFLAEDDDWVGLIGEQKVAELSFMELSKTRRLLNGVVSLKKRERIHAALQGNGGVLEDLLSICGRIRERLTDEEFAVIEPLVLARTLYEADDFESEYRFNTEEREALYLDLYAQRSCASEPVDVLDDVLYIATHKLQKIDRNELRRVRRLRKRRADAINKLIDDINAHGSLRKTIPKEYHRTRDQILFAQQVLEGMSVEDMRKEVSLRGLDPLIGYIAILGDFTHYPLDRNTRRILTLRPFKESLGEKIRARMMQQ